MAQPETRPVSRSIWIAILILGLASLFFLSSFFLFPLLEQQGLLPGPPPRISSPSLVMGQNYLGTGNFLVTGGEVLLPLWFFNRHIDPQARWYPQEQTLVITTRDRVVRLGPGNLTARVNQEPMEIRFPLKIIEGIPYIPMVFLSGFYGLQVEYLPEKERIVLDRLDEPFLTGQVISKKGLLREGASLGTRVKDSLPQGEKVIIYSEDQGYYRVRTPRGQLGYLHKSSAALGEIGSIQGDKSPKPAPWNPTGGKVNLTWEFVHRQNPDPEDIPPMPGLNVVSPTWFHLADQEGSIQNLADPGYVQWAHDRGYQVWALFSNNFDRDLTRAVLGSPSKREYMINQLLLFAGLYDLDGINVDFENMYLEDRENLVQFMRELAPPLHQQGLVLSIDVTFISSSVHWSQIYDRKALGEIVDYVIVMAYDEHWASSPTAGSVASLPWVERGLQRLLEEVPPHKVILGVPFYTRLWKEEKKEDGGVRVSSTTYYMFAVENILKEKGIEPVWDESTGQYYAEYTTPEGRFRTWLEEEKSMASRIHLVRQYDLAGVASWRRGMEKPVIWEVIEEILTRRPYK